MSDMNLEKKNLER